MAAHPAYVPALWAVLVGAALLARPLVPLDETRYLAVAWEMWTRGDFLVPHLNGVPYPDKPPLLFWLIDAGWAVLGVNEWWPRLVAPGFALMTALLARHMAVRMWPAWPRAGLLAPVVLLGSAVWLVFATLTMFDVLIAFFALLGLRGLWGAAAGERTFWLYGLAIGLGVLAKGPVILLHLLPAALLAPWWAGGGIGSRWGWWYARVLGWTLAGAALALGWALPAAAAGGSDYAHAILWRQTAGRMVQSFAHQRPWWWYLPLLPVAMLPWSAWPGLWRGLGALGGGDRGVRLCVVWLGCGFIGLCLLSGKQPHYLVPLVPGVSLLVARALAPGERLARHDIVPGLVLVLVGAALLGARVLGPGAGVPAMLQDGLLASGLPILVLGALVVVAGEIAPAAAAVRLGAVMGGVLVAIHTGLVRGMDPVWDVRPVASYLARVQARGEPVAYQGNYHGQYQFIGRLQDPLEEVWPGTEAQWAARHPRGILIARRREGCPAGYRRPPELTARFRGRVLDLWDARDLRMDPSLAVEPCRGSQDG